MLGSNDLDIYNSENWDDSKWMDFFKDRLQKMKSERPDDKFDKFDEQTTAISYYDNEGILQINIPLEKTIGEIYMGKTKGKVKYEILPDGQANIEELQPAKFAMDFFLDGNQKDNFWKENKLMREYKHKYGEGIYYTGIRNYKEIVYEPKEGEEFQSGTDLLDKDKFEENEKETWFFFPKAVHPKDFYIDDRAVGQPDVQYADDCIYKERVTATELKIRYGKINSINQEILEKVDYRKDPDPINKKSGNTNREIILFHYYHRITKKYMIVANNENLLFNGLYLYNDGKLPFTGIQHYSVVDRFRGEGYPERISYLKAYKSEVFQDILTGSAMSSGINLLTGNDSQVGKDWNLGNRQVNIWRNTGDVDQVKQINTSPNLGYFTTVMDLINKEVTINSGVNPSEQFEQNSERLGIIEIQEANKLVRNASVDENYEIGLDDALTMMFSRIKQFAPSLLKREELGTDGETLKVIFPQIKIDNYKVEKEKEKGKIILTEDIGKYGYFSLEPDVVQGVGVKVVTSSTSSITPIIERQKINDYFSNLSKLFEIAKMDESGESMTKLVQFTRFDELLGWVSDAYDYDINGLKANSEKDEIAKKNIEKQKVIKKFLKPNIGKNVENTGNIQNKQAIKTGTSGGEGEMLENIQGV